MILQAIHDRKRELDRNSHVGFVSWVIEALDKGAVAAHKWTSMKTKAPPLPHVVEDEQGRVLSPHPIKVNITKGCGRHIGDDM